MNHIYEIFGTDAHEMTRALMEAADVIRQIPTGASVALKPNLVKTATADQGAITHPGVLSGCISYLKEHGITDISVIESSWVGDQTDRAFQVSSYEEVCRRYEVPFYDLKKDKIKSVDTPDGPIAICRRALETDFLIDLPVLKGHCQTVMTCALKNLKGCIPDREKRRFHARGLTRPIAALASVLKPQLVIVDSICGDLSFEEGGNPVQTNRMYLGWDAVQIDAYGCRLMGLDVSDVEYLPLAAEWGAGELAIAEDTVIALNEPQAGEVYTNSSSQVRTLTKHVHADSACSACYASLVRALYTLQTEGKPFAGDLYIGQGWRQKAVNGIGIGNCCRGAEVCVKGCPPTAQEIRAALAGKR